MKPESDSPYPAELAETLWLERRVLEYLLFALVEANLSLVADVTSFDPFTIGEVEKVMEKIREAEHRRDSVLAAVAAELGIAPSGLTLDFLLAEASEPVRSEFERLRKGFLMLAGEIERLTLENRRMATSNLDVIGGTLGLSADNGCATAYDTMLDDQEAALIANDAAAIDASLDLVLNGSTTLGVPGARIESDAKRGLADQQTIGSQIGEIEDIDIAEAIMELQLQDTAYRAALVAFGVTNQYSLVDFLR